MNKTDSIKVVFRIYFDTADQFLYVQGEISEIVKEWFIRNLLCPKLNENPH